MKLIEIRKEAGVKTWNGRTLEAVLSGLDRERFDTDLLETLFHSVESESAFVDELRKIRDQKKHTTASLLLYILFLTNLSLREATDLLDKTL
jgi:hypothetical protein